MAEIAIPFAEVQQKLAVNQKTIHKTVDRAGRFPGNRLHHLAGNLQIRAGLALRVVDGFVKHCNPAARRVMRGKHRPKIHIKNFGATTNQNCFRPRALQIRAVFDNIPQHKAALLRFRAKNTARQQKQAAVFAVKAPFLAGPHVIHNGAIKVGSHQTNGANTSVHHIGYGKIQQPVTPAERQRSQ